MKFVAFFAVFLLLVDLSVQIPKLVNCSAEVHARMSTAAEGCGVVTCHGPDSMTGVGCGTYRCAEGKRLGYKPSDSSKPYPECCGGPICAD